LQQSQQLIDTIAQFIKDKGKVEVSAVVCKVMPVLGGL
jgi:hypothetical protein